MAFGVENSKLVLAFLSEPYFDSKSCKKELNYADVLGIGFTNTSFGIQYI